MLENITLAVLRVLRLICGFINKGKAIEFKFNS